MKPRKQRSYYFGIMAERAAIFWLMLKGYRLVAQRYKSPFGEIDIIMKKRNTIIFVEVKARNNSINNHDLISTTQQKRITRAGLNYIQQHPQLHQYALRFDAIFVIKYIKIKHITNAWQ